MNKPIVLSLPDDLTAYAEAMMHSTGKSLEDVINDWLRIGANRHLRLYTIGHSNLSFDDFLSRLGTHHITTVVDVRSEPYSKYTPHFSKRELQTALEAHGIIYRYAGEFLGGRPADKSVYQTGTVISENTSRDAYLDLVDYTLVMKRDWYHKGLQRLIDIIQEAHHQHEHVVIMCSEGDPEDCHRHHLITRSLIDPAVQSLPNTPVLAVYHILKDGHLQFVNPTVFKKPEQQRLF
ncbi:MAG: hypothetical protein CUN52_09885 [Phototrophicales bacterium]|jgi:hypothetical protein|nr:MAG: hypothetical protein CUN52_09885 [Phototrophicales bacterium]